MLIAIISVGSVSFDKIGKRKMNKIKWLAIIVVGVIVIIAIAGIIKFNILEDDIYIQNEDGTVEKFDDVKHGNSSYQSEVMLKLFNIKTSNDLIINIPETNLSTKIKNFVLIDLIYEMGQGTYSDGTEKGIVLLDYVKIRIAHISNSKNNIYFVIPFIVSNQGSGAFYYLGLFEQKINELKITHLDSYFLGDRIKINNIKVGENKIDVKYKTHSPEQSMSETPTKSKSVTIETTINGFKKKEET